ncbi:NapC/NirT family cytochrome c [Campylobacter sp. faydin G-105]|uniref:cytochrome c3 family protein n=1 Tax=Campylobacter anatolicus TaxID=2829105 RepID=UPI001B969826|nr:NapC/NirT family cytochrome c [Campylobacter anatolicus]MBR8461431.1 NapC/NirT family cytochrome c [Campylobacter anatolicus]
MKISKKLLVLIIFISGIIGFLVVLPVHYALKETSGDKFCVVCHEMDPMVIAYNDDIHSGKGATGLKAKCVDCHIPHDNLAKYVLTKAKNGIVEGYIHFFGDPDKIDWHKRLENKEKFVFDNGCMSCHTDILGNTASKPQAIKMHAHYEKLLRTDKELKCVSCHFDAGHSAKLRNYLEYWQPSYKIYEKKMMQMKIETKKAFFKDKYEPSKDEREFMDANKNKEKKSGHE